MLKVQIKSNWKWTTNVTITVRDLTGKVIDVKRYHNIVTTVGLAMIIDAFQGTVTDCEIKYIAVGDDNTTPVIGDTTLVSETFRKATTSFSEASSTSLETVCYIAPDEAVGQIEEIGWFAGTDAGAGADSGIMISRVLYSHDKSALESIQVERTDTIAEA